MAATAHFNFWLLKGVVMSDRSVFYIISRDSLRVILGAALGVFCWEMVRNFQSEAQAQAGRITLQALQAQLDSIVNGATIVGRAQVAVAADSASFAVNAEALGGLSAADYQKQSQVVQYVAGQGLASSRSGQVVTLSASAGYFDSNYLRLSGGTLSGQLNAGNVFLNLLDGVTLQGDRLTADFGVRVGFTSEAASAGNLGLLRFNPTSQKLEVSTGSAWVPVH